VSEVQSGSARLSLDREILVCAWKERWNFLKESAAKKRKDGTYQKTMHIGANFLPENH
jgi:hypothetical protein